MLLKQELKDFSLANWRSNIRGEVRAHDKYKFITDWAGSETADFSYDDINGDLTSLLVKLGYDIPVSPPTRGVKYFLEVKTTTKACETRFYMSKAQYIRVGQYLPHTPQQ